MRRTLALAVLTLAGAAGAGAAHVDAGRAADSEPLTARGTLTPATIRFADTLVADLEVAYDPAHVDGASIRVVPDFAPFAATAPPTVSHEQRNGLDVLRMRYSLQCVSAGCLPGKTPREVHFQRGTVTGTRDGRPFEAAQIWPTLRVVSRLSDRAGSGEIAFRHQRDLPAPAYRVSAGALAAGLTATAVLAVAAAVALLVLALRRRRAHPRPEDVSALERALRFVRDSAKRPDPADRRRALELLAEAVEDTGDDHLAGRVRDAAWVETAPTPSRSTELVEDVETERGRV